MRTLLWIFFFFPGATLIAGQPDWTTPFEKSGFLKTATYEETIQYCQLLASFSDSANYTSFGSSPQRRDLPLLIIDKDGMTSPEEVRKAGKAVILFEAGIHPGEIDGNDAGLMFFRDLLVEGQFPGLLDHQAILFIPIFNVDGHARSGPFNRINQNGPEEMGWRTTAQNLNLNRDFLKVDSPEMKQWLVLFQQWLPDFFVDIHVTDGADYKYVTTYEVETLGNMDQGITDWCQEVLEHDLVKGMKEAGYDIFPYVMFRRWHDPRSGLRKQVAPPRLSHGYTAQQNRPGLLIENHALKDFKTRVYATYEMIHLVCNIINGEAARLVQLNQTADNYAASQEFREQTFPLVWRNSGDSVMVTFEGFAYDIVKSDLTGGPWFIYHPDQPMEYKLPYFKAQEIAREITLPEAYIIPPEWTEVIERLNYHGIQYKKLSLGDTVRVETYRFSNPDFARSPYEGRFRVEAEYTTQMERRFYPPGSVIIPLAQRTSRIIANIFEPDAPDSYFGWGFFNVIFEQKEYAETYVMEKVAREMIEQDPLLMNEFEKKRREDPDFANNQWAQLNWFYKKSPWWDEKKNLYPAARITDRKILERLYSDTH